MHYAILSAIGEDRPGLVDAISRFALQCGCNIEDSRMAILGDQFAMLILLGGSQEALEELRLAADSKGREIGLSLQVRATRPGREKASSVLPYEINAYSLDHPGIVQQIAHFLAQRKINIRALDTEVRNAPHSGEPVFSLRARIDVPSNINLAELRRGLQDVASEENIDLEIVPSAR